MLYEKWDMPDPNFPIKIQNTLLLNENGNIIFQNHWHEKIEFLYFIRGKAVIQCNSNPIHVKEGDLIVVNSNDLHQGESLCDVLEYYCIIVDTSLLESRSVDTCEVKYIAPISQNNILFKNKVSNDVSIKETLDNIISEYENKQIGYEIAIKSSIYRLLVLLMRNHVQLILTPKEYNARIRNFERFNQVLQYIEDHYTEDLNIDMFCKMINISRFYFCRLFKQLTGKTLSEYVNYVRINKAEKILKETTYNVSETSMMVGFDNVNYFSRLYKRYKKMPPSSVHKVSQSKQTV